MYCFIYTDISVIQTNAGKLLNVAMLTDGTEVGTVSQTTAILLYLGQKNACSHYQGSRKQKGLGPKYSSVSVNQKWVYDLCCNLVSLDSKCFLLHATTSSVGDTGG